jgi:hypothetical protein
VNDHEARFEIEIASHTTDPTWTGGSYVKTANLSEAIVGALDEFIDAELQQGRVNTQRLIIVVTPQ